MLPRCGLARQRAARRHDPILIREEVESDWPHISEVFRLAAADADSFAYGWSIPKT